MTEQGPEYLEAIVAASRNLNVSVEDLTQDQFIGYIERNSNERRKALKLVQPEAIQELDWEKAKEFAVIIDSASKQIAEKHRFKIDIQESTISGQNWKLGKFIAVKSRKSVIQLSLLTTLLLVMFSIGVLVAIDFFHASTVFQHGIIPVIAFALIIGPIASYIIFTQSYLITQAISKLEELSKTDPLTGLFNKRFFTELVDMELAVASRYAFSSSLLLIDLDHFKSINDAYGHLAGDEVIRIIANVIRRNVRRTDVVGRYSSEDFVVFLPHTNIQGALVAADRIRRIISESEITFKNLPIKVTASIGAASTGSEIEGIEQLLQTAGSALDLAKEKGQAHIECLPPVYEGGAMPSEVVDIHTR